MKVYAAEIEDTATKSQEKSAEITENSENAEKGKTKEITLSDITWEIDAAESDGEVFDSSEECDGYCYVYAELTFTHASDYTIVFAEEDMKGAADHNGDGEDHPSVPETSDNGLKAWILLIGSLVMVIGIGTFYITRRKKEKE